MVNFKDLLNHKSPGYSSTIPIDIGDYKLSIQASQYHHCTPRETHGDYSIYTHMEIAIFKNDEWVHPSLDKLILKFNRYEELVGFYEHVDQETYVGAYIPVDLIQALYEYLVEETETIDLWKWIEKNER